MNQATQRRTGSSRGDLAVLVLYLVLRYREAFDSPDELPAHHLYVCLRDSLGLVNHLAVRNYLRAHPETAQAYGDLKKRLADQFPHDIDSYGEGKTELILDILREAGFLPEQLQEIEAANRKASRNIQA